jgi:hypothetical protein
MDAIFGTRSHQQRRRGQHRRPDLWVPKTRPSRSSGMCVLVKDAGESILSPGVEVIQSARICDRFRSWAQGCCTMQGPMGSVPVVEQLELTQCLHQLRLIPDQGAVQQLAPAGLHPVGLENPGWGCGLGFP